LSLESDVVRTRSAPTATVHLAIWLGCLLPQFNLLGASAWSTRAWQAEEGLPDNNVTGAAQTPEGYLWVSTHSGLARFDGVRFQLMPLPGTTARSNSLVRAMFLGQGSAVWVALEAERGIVAGFSRNLTHVFTAADGLSSSKPLNLAQTRDGAMWVGYVDGSVCRLAKGKVTRFGAAEGLTGMGGCWLATDAEGELWYAKAGRVGVFRADQFEARFSLPERVVRIAGASDGGLWVGAGKRLLKSSGTNQPVLLRELPTDRPGVEPFLLFEDRQRGLWIGTTAGGLFHWDGREIVATETSHSDITSITEDREGNIWVGTEGGGLNRLRNRVLELHGSAAGLPFDATRSIGKDADGVIWATGANGSLVRRKQDAWETVLEGAGWTGARATCVVGDGLDGVWIGTTRGGLVHHRAGKFRTLGRAEGLGGDNIRALLVDSRTNLWIGLETPFALQRFAGNKFVTIPQPPGSRTIRTIVEDSKRQIWLGTSDGFLFRVEGDALVDETARVVQPPKPIRALYADGEGGLWIAYAGAGLGRLREGKFVAFGTERGLPDNYISGIASDGGNTLWLAAGHGIFAVSKRELEKTLSPGAERVMVVDYGRNESLPNLQGSYGHWPSSHVSSDGRLWFATRSGLIAVNQNRVQPNRIPPTTVIERVMLDGRELTLRPGEALRIPPGHRQLRIEYTAFSFAAPESLSFKYQLRAWEDAWSEPDAKRVAEFQRLGAGAYEFNVTARSSAGVWHQQGANLRFVVEPFFWQRWSFRLLGGGLAFGLLAWAIHTYERRRVRARLVELERQHAVERERARIARDIHDELGTGLTQISLLADVGCVKPGDATEAEANFIKIAERARSAVQSLDEIVWAANPRNDFLPRVADYLCHLVDDGFEGSEMRRRKEVPTSLPLIPVRAEARHNLALAVKESLANTLKHSRATTVRLKLEWNEPELVVTVEDDGEGFDRTRVSRLGEGLGNQSARMAEIGGTIAVHSTPGQGTRTVFRMRLEAGAS
jgi:signal transduction histidine kinase/ligand-binding sensor domain-containing protein